MTNSTPTKFSGRYHELIREFPLRQLKTKKDADAATAILDRLIHRDHKDRGEAAYVYTLALLLHDYEQQHDVTPNSIGGLEVLRALVEENQIRQADLAILLGIRQSAVSMVLNGQRPITAEHARRLGRRFAVNPGVFIQDSLPKSSQKRHTRRVIATV